MTCMPAAGERQSSWQYSNLLSTARFSGIAFDGERAASPCRRCRRCSPATSRPYQLFTYPRADLPGFTRSVYERNYALVTPESFVFAGNPLWENATTAHIISPAVGANFAMLLANMKQQSSGAKPPEGHERCGGTWGMDVECLVCRHPAASKPSATTSTLLHHHLQVHLCAGWGG